MCNDIMGGKAACIFSQLSLYKKGTVGTLYSNWTAPIAGESVLIVILG